MPPTGFDSIHAMEVPTTDRLGKRTAWDALEKLPDGYLDSSPDANFKWWLWLGNLGKITHEVLGVGVTSAYLRRRSSQVKWIICTRADGSAYTVELSMWRSGDPKTRAWPCPAPA